MTAATQLLPMLVLLPLGVAALMLVAAHWLPGWVSDVVSILVSLALAAIAAVVATTSLRTGAPVEHWFGGWGPGAHGSGRLILGIAFRADAASAGIAVFVALMFAATFAFAWGYFDRIHSHFQILMLLFLAGMLGFCVTGDLFDLFVWFELMSVSAFALTAYPLGQGALDGAFNFVVTNALAGFMMLGACGLVYARCGTLDIVAIGRVAQGLGRDPVFAAALVLLTAGLLTKAAMVPFHFWLADAHAVAPSPVSVIFSGAMVPVALFGYTKLLLVAFLPDAALVETLRPLLVTGGCATAVLASLTAWSQRHLKRLLAFSTISHLGIMLAGAASLTAAGASGFVLYLIGHGLVKGALFMVAGILLALCASPDELVLYGRGRRYWPAGVVMAIAGLMLAGLPVGPLHAGTELIHRATGTGFADWAISVGEVMTGAAVLRAALRIFAGCSGQPGVELLGPTVREREHANRPFALMLMPPAIMVATAFFPAGWLRGAAARGITAMTGRPQALALPEPATGMPWESIVTVGLALVVVGVTLLRVRPTRPLARRLFSVERAPFATLEFLHSGVVGDYVAWVAVGLATLAAWAGAR